MTLSGPVLVVAQEPMIAALVGALVELTGARPAFARADEQPGDAIQRLRSLAIVLIDVAVDAVHSDLFFALASRRGLGVVVFGAPDRARDIAEVAGARSIPWFTLPPDLAHVRVALELATGSGGARQGGERRRPAARKTPDGTRILLDSAGRFWMVYDRRTTSDRRDQSSDLLERVFVGEGGEQLHCSVEATEQSDASEATLIRQLERATPV